MLAPAPVSEETEVVSVPVDKLHDHPANPVDRVSKDGIADLLPLIKEFEQREPVRVRDREGLPIGHYEILSGHRRAACCRKLKRDVKVIIVQCDDTDALREVLLGNEGRRDLNPIQRAEKLQELIATAGIPRDEAGRLLNLNSESGIKNTLRMLALPPSIRALIQSGDITSKGARYLVPYAAATTILNRFAKDFKRHANHFRSNPKRCIENCLSYNASHANCRPMDGKTKYRVSWEYKDTPRKFSLKDLDEKTLKELDVAELPIGRGGKVIEVSQNVKLFDRLNRPHLVKDTSYGIGSRSPSAKKKSTAKMTPKELATEKRRKAAAAKKQLADRSEVWARRFRLMCLASQTPECHPVIFTTIAWWIKLASMPGPMAWVEAAATSLQCPPIESRKYGIQAARADEVATMIASVADRDSDTNSPPGYALLDRLWRILVWPQRLDWPEGPIAEKLDERTTVEPPAKTVVDVKTNYNDDAIAMQLDYADVSIGGGWRDAADGGVESMLVREWLNLHNSDQLVKLAKDCSVDLGTLKTKADKVNCLMLSHKPKSPLPLPAVLQDKSKAGRKRKK